MNELDNSPSPQETASCSDSQPPASHRPENDCESAQPPTHQCDSQVKATPQRTLRRTFSTAHKLKILEQYDACDNPLSKGELLRKEGLYHSAISNWKKLRDQGKLAGKTKSKPSKAALNNQKLARENAALKKQLAQAEAIIDLQKKVSALFGEHILQPQNSETD